MRQDQNGAVALRDAGDELAGNDGLAAAGRRYQQDSALASRDRALDLGDDVHLIRAEHVGHGVRPVTSTIFQGRVRALPLLGQQVALQAAKRAALVAVDQAADGLIEGHLAVFDKHVPGTGERQEHEARDRGGSWPRSSPRKAFGVGLYVREIGAPTLPLRRSRLCLCCWLLPNAIAGLVITIDVDAIERQAGGRVPHVGKEIYEV